MEIVQGQTLAAVLAGGPLGQAIEIATGVAEGFTHAKGIVHRSQARSFPNDRRFARQVCWYLSLAGRYVTMDLEK